MATIGCSITFSCVTGSTIWQRTSGKRPNKSVNSALAVNGFFWATGSLVAEIYKFSTALNIAMVAINSFSMLTHTMIGIYDYYHPVKYQKTKEG